MFQCAQPAFLGSEIGVIQNDRCLGETFREPPDMVRVRISWRAVASDGAAHARGYFQVLVQPWIVRGIIIDRGMEFEANRAGGQALFDLGNRSIAGPDPYQR